MTSLIFALTLILSSPLSADEVPDNIVIIKENSVSIEEVDGELNLLFELEIIEGFFAYEDKFEININDFDILEFKIDPIVSFFDQTFQKTKHGVRNKAKIKALVHQTSKATPGSLDLSLVYQACTPEYCLFPTQAHYTHTLTEKEKSQLSAFRTPEWLRKGLLLSLLFVFIAGFLTSLTPCVYPMLPITIAVLGTNRSSSRTRGFLRSLTYVLGMASTYSALGILASTTGFMFGSLLSNSYFIVFLSIVLFVGALSMFDIFEIQTPRFLQSRLSVQKNTTSYLALFATGLFSGLIVGPCVGPVLVGILGYVSQAGSLPLGFGLLFTFALGLGSLIIVLGTFTGLFEKIPRSGKWMVVVKKFLGLAFLGLILYFLSPLLKIRELTLAASAIAALFTFIMILKNRKNPGRVLFEKSLYLSTLVFSVILFSTAFSISDERFERLFGYSGSTFANTYWDVFTDEKLALAKDNEQYVVLDFYADWCAACRELKHNTFSDLKVANYSSKIKWLYFDSTKPSKRLDELKKRYKVLGLPTILFFDSKGELQPSLTLTGFENPEFFIKRLDNLFKKDKNETANP